MRNLKIKLKKKENPLTKYIRDQIEHENNCVMIITGNTGSGKTMSCLGLASGLVAEDFPVDYIAQSMIRIQEIMLEALDNPEKFYGKVIIYEEPQTEITNKRSMSNEAVSFTNMLSTFRDLRCIFIMTTPRLHQITKDSLQYIDFWLETQYIDREHNLCHLKIKYADFNELTQKTYWKYPEVSYEGVIYRFDRLAVKLPPKKLADYYKEAKREFQRSLFRKDLEKNKRKRDKFIVKKEKPKRVCPSCKYEWETIVKNPKKCPNCQERLQRATTT